MSVQNTVGIAFVSCLVLGSPSALAQPATGTIAGVVRDTTGAVLPGVTVEAASPALIERIRTVVTDEHGEYKIVELRPGIYAVTFSLAGFNTARREGIELTTGFTATANAELRVGAIEETVTVSGATPVVDIQNARSQNVLSRGTLDAVPTAQNYSAFGSLTLGAVPSGFAGGRDVGGNSGEWGSLSLTIHGSRGDGIFSFDGMRSQSLLGEGQLRRMQVNQAATQEVVLQTGAMTAETETGGVTTNIVPKDGGNTFKGTVDGDYTGSALQSQNLNDALRARGLTRANSDKYIYGFGAGVGGPVLRDKLWFFASTHEGSAREELAGTYFNKRQNTLFYEPDLSRPGYSDQPTKDYINVRVTWQVATKHRIVIMGANQEACLCFLSLGPTRSPEGSWSGNFYERLLQPSWTYPATQRLLFEAAMTARDDSEHNIPAPGVSLGDRSVSDLGTGLTYGSFVSGDNPPLYNVNGWLNDYGTSVSHYYNTRFAMSYVTGSHAVKTGLTTSSGFQNYGPGVPNFPEQYTFRNGVPVGLTELASPGFSQTRLKVNLGVFAQDQWTLKKVTLNLGVRFDYLNAYNPAQTRPAGTYTPEFQFAALTGVPRWKDISPRLGVAYDVRGNGKTAVKASLGRYVNAQATRIAQQTNASNSIVGTTFRTWNDGNGNYVPDCNLQNPLTNGECGQLSNLAFGTAVVNTHFASDFLSGWMVRPYSWQASTSVQHELRPGVAVTAGYFRTWYGNFLVTQNRAVAAADFSPYCITEPVDSRLPGGGGNQLCGLYDINPSRFGQVDSFVTKASAFGTLTDVFNGVNLGINARFGRGGLLFGGASLGQEVANNCALKDLPNVVVNATYSGANFNPAGSTAFCELTLPQKQVKLAGSYPLPWWGIQASGTFQNLQGIPRTASYVATNAQIAPSLGRDLGQCGGSAACNGTVTISHLFAPNSVLEPRQNQLDVRVTKLFRVGRVSLQPRLDIYNLFNASDIQSLNTRYGATWLNAGSILAGRLVKFGAKLDF